MRRPDPDIAAIEADRRVVWTEDVLRFCDTDANGHINNSAFSVFCESGRVRFLHEVLKEGRLPDSFFAIVRIAIEFRAELLYPGRVRCGTWVEAMGRTSMTFRQILLDGDGRLAGTGEGVCVQMSFADRRPLPLGERMRALLEPLLMTEPSA